MLCWLRDNSAALTVIGALASPIVVLIGTVFVAPLMQQRIARNTLRMTQAQITAGLYGSADHQWITDFRAAIVETLVLGAERLSDASKGARPSPEAVSAFARRFTIAATQIHLMSWDDAGDKLHRLAINYTRLTMRADAVEEAAAAATALVTKAAEVIRRREARLATYASTASA
jgi:hypothetical protein